MNCNRIDLPPINKTCLKWQGKALNSSIPSSLQSFVDEASIIKLIGDLSSTCYSNLIGEYGWCYTIHGLKAWGYCSRSCMMGQNPMDKELVCVGPHSVWKSHELQYFPAAKLKLPFDFVLVYQSFDSWFLTKFDFHLVKITRTIFLVFQARYASNTETWVKCDLSDFQTICVGKDDLQFYFRQLSPSSRSTSPFISSTPRNVVLHFKLISSCVWEELRLVHCKFPSKLKCRASPMRTTSLPSMASNRTQ